MELTFNQALTVLIQAAHKAQKVGGVFTLDEASLVNEAVKVFTPQDKPTDKPTDEASVETSEIETTDVTDPA